MFIEALIWNLPNPPVFSKASSIVIVCVIDCLVDLVSSD